jgi:uncharacterized protein YndB with AHSA1/START domain
LEYSIGKFKNNRMDIFHSFPINELPEKVFAGISTADGLNEWWTLNCEEDQEIGGIYTLDFGPQYQWKAVVTKFESGQEFELKFTEADDDWINTIVGFALKPKGMQTDVEFYHTGWKKNNEHYRISGFCWAMYLRILKRFLEYGERVAYEKRLHV